MQWTRYMTNRRHPNDSGPEVSQGLPEGQRRLVVSPPWGFGKAGALRLLAGKPDVPSLDLTPGGARSGAN